VGEVHGFCTNGEQGECGGAKLLEKRFTSQRILNTSLSYWYWQLPLRQPYCELFKRLLGSRNQMNRLLRIFRGFHSENLLGRWDGGRGAEMGLHVVLGWQSLLLLVYKWMGKWMNERYGLGGK